MPGGVEAEDTNPAAVRLAKAFGALHGRRFPRSVGSEQAEDLTLFHLQGDIVYSDNVAIGFMKVIDFNHDAHAHGRYPVAHSPHKGEIYLAAPQLPGGVAERALVGEYLPPVLSESMG